MKVNKKLRGKKINVVNVKFFYSSPQFLAKKKPNSQEFGGKNHATISQKKFRTSSSKNRGLS